MVGGLDGLLKINSVRRSEQDYAAVLDDFFSDLGGGYLSDHVVIPPGVKNADYFVRKGNCDLIVELKQIGSSENSGSFFHRTMKFMANKGGIELKIAGTNRAISGKDPGASRWLSFYDYAWPAIPRQLKKANNQLAQTDRLLAKSPIPRARGVMLFNTGDYDLSNDLLRLLVEVRMKYAWIAGHFGAIDFVIAGTLDLGGPDSHPQEVFLLKRNSDDPEIRSAVDWIWKAWQDYVINEIGEEADREFAAQVRLDRDWDARFTGKLQRRDDVGDDS